MKKIVGLILVLAFTVVLGSSAWAADTIPSTTEYTGVATFTGSGEITVSFSLKTISDETSAGELTWNSKTNEILDAFNTTSDDKWVRADQYAEVYAKSTKASGFSNLAIYTDNTKSTEYKATNARRDYSDATHYTNVYNGLVKKLGTGRGVDGYIPLVFAYSVEKDSSIQYNPNAADSDLKKKSAEVVKKKGGNVVVSGDSGFNDADAYVIRVNKGITDKEDKKQDGRTSNFDKNYAVIAYPDGPAFGYSSDESYTGYWGSSAIVSNTAYMYFFGNFKNIVGGDIYGSDKITVAVELN